MAHRDVAHRDVALAGVALAGEVLRGRAATLARSGRHEDAVLLLTELAAGREHTAAEHDLLARIQAQRGRLDEAERHWRAALALEPDAGGAIADGAAAGLHHLRRLRADRVGARRRDGLAAGLLVLLALGGGWWLGHDGPDRPDQVPAAAPLSAPAAGTVPAPEGAARRPVDDLAARLAGPEATVTGAGGQLVVAFHDPIFTVHDTPSPQGRATLSGLGARLAAVPGIAVEIVGHSDGLPVRAGGPYPDNAALSLARAAAAAETLRGAGVPATALTISAGGGAVAPYPDGAAGDPRNRTVTLRVTPPA
ncbi:flagellar motor protein MotB [Frankia sp. EI5c]|uniref:flagellar motor protein MotB n=1 Tax=Frankia sp. EI5c TaxID=683316 RepID=UPI000A7DEAF4|nr:flagellar motor protein MotB [Frankia sp. EI5c]